MDVAMIPEHPKSSPDWIPDRATLLPPLALMLLTVVLQLGGVSVRLLLRYERAAVGAGEWWRLLTAHLVHLSTYHLALNLGAIAVWLLLCPQRWSAGGWVLRYSWVALAIGVGLWFFEPDEANYVGLSGVVHGLFVLGLLTGVRAGDRWQQAAFAALCAKLAWEQLTGVPVSDETAIGGHVVTSAHFFGAISALGYAALEAVWQGCRRQMTNNAAGDT